MTERIIEKIAILPAYNLENSIGEIVKNTKKFVDLVIVVTDGSNDNTNMKASESGAICPPHSNNRGKGYAIRKGIEFSKTFKSQYVIFMDSDGQHLPEEIPQVVSPIIEGKADMVVGSRMKGELKTSTINKIGNFVLKIISFCVTGRWFTDTESGFRAFSTNKLYELTLTSNSYEIESELLLKSLHQGFRIVEVPITVPKAVPGVTVSDGIKMGIYKIKLGLTLKLQV